MGGDFDLFPEISELKVLCPVLPVTADNSVKGKPSDPSDSRISNTAINRNSTNLQKIDTSARTKAPRYGFEALFYSDNENSNVDNFKDNTPVHVNGSNATGNEISYSSKLIGVTPSTPALIPVRNGDFLSLKILDDYYATRLKVFDKALIGRTIYSKGDKPLPVSLLSEKLKLMWNLSSNFRIISVGKGYFTLIFNNDKDFGKVWSRRSWPLSPGLFRLQPWVQDFNPDLLKSSLAQIWMRIYDLGCEFWDVELLSGIARTAGTPLKIDYNTLHGMSGHFARVLVEVDISQPLPEKLLFHRPGHSSFITFSYESLPDYCKLCDMMGHSVVSCRRTDQNVKHTHTSTKIISTSKVNFHPATKPKKWVTKSGMDKDKNVAMEKGSKGTADKGKNVVAGNSKQDMAKKGVRVENKFSALGDLEDEGTQKNRCK